MSDSINEEDEFVPPPILVFCDTETTGLHPELHDIWEWAGIRREWKEGSGYVEESMSLQIRVPLGNADPYALKIGGFWDRYIGDQETFYLKQESAWDPDDAARMIRRFTHEAMLVGTNIAFDADRTARLLYKWDQVPSWHYQTIDIKSLLVGYLTAKGVPVPIPPGSKWLSEAIGVPEPSEGRHTAMGDALWVRAQWDALGLS